MKRSFLPGRIPNFPLWSNKPREFHPARYGIFVQFKQGMIFDYARSVHGSPYAYDRLVPVIFYGAGVPHRETFARRPHRRRRADAGRTRWCSPAFGSRRTGAAEGPRRLILAA